MPMDPVDIVIFPNTPFFSFDGYIIWRLSLREIDGEKERIHVT